MSNDVGESFRNFFKFSRLFTQKQTFSNVSCQQQLNSHDVDLESPTRFRFPFGASSSQLNLIKIALIQIEANSRTMNPNKTATLGKVTRLTVVIHHFGCISIGMLRRTNWKPVEFHEVIPRNRHLQFHDLFSCLSTLIKGKKIVVDIGALFSAFLQHMLETSGSDIPGGGE